MLWQGWIRMVISTISEIGKELEHADKDKLGIDDLVGGIIVGVGHILEAILNYSDSPQTEN
jgi:NADH/NAD ratio-sensing transcriptional regulator Rex